MNDKLNLWLFGGEYQFYKVVQRRNEIPKKAFFHTSDYLMNEDGTLGNNVDIYRSITPKETKEYAIIRRDLTL